MREILSATTFSSEETWSVRRATGVLIMAAHWRRPSALPMGECLLAFFDQDSLTALSPEHKTTGL
eukprot:scaffold268532_cov149-Cyclotella_meneghiniana.AAC.1